MTSDYREESPGQVLIWKAGRLSRLRTKNSAHPAEFARMLHHPMAQWTHSLGLIDPEYWSGNVFQLGLLPVNQSINQPIHVSISNVASRGSLPTQVLTFHCLLLLEFPIAQ